MKFMVTIIILAFSTVWLGLGASIISLILYLFGI
jgi:hypothetical protein